LTPRPGTLRAVGVYLDGEVPKLAGRSTAQTAISKWGGHGTHIWEHALWDVPDVYGNEARFFEPLPRVAEIFRDRAADQWALM